MFRIPNTIDTSAYNPNYNNSPTPSDMERPGSPSGNAGASRTYSGSPESSSPTLDLNKIELSKSEKQDLIHKMNDISAKVGERTQLSTTGYQTAMVRLANKKRPDYKSFMILQRAEQYTQKAKETYPDYPLAQLANLQKNHINQVTDNGASKLKSPMEMSLDELTQTLIKCREKQFSNCDMQALEVAIHLRHNLGIADFTIFRNNMVSHNYVVLNPSNTFPKGAIIDSWTGQGFLELNFSTKVKYSHFEKNLEVNQNMLDWVNQRGREYVFRN